MKKIMLNFLLLLSFNEIIAQTDYQRLLVQVSNKTIIPSRIYGTDSLIYRSIQDKYNIIINQPKKVNFSKKQDIVKLETLLTSKDLNLTPAFDDEKVETLYDRLAHIKQASPQLCPVEALHNIFVTEMCYDEKTCKVLRDSLSKNSIHGIQISYECLSQAISSNTFTQTTDSTTGDNYYRELMQINELNKISSGKGSNLIIVEKSNVIKKHPEFEHRQDLYDPSKIVVLDTVIRAIPHATHTAGVLFSKNDNLGSNGVCDSASLKKLICFGGNICNLDKGDGKYNNQIHLNAILHAVVAAEQGDIILFEFSTENNHLIEEDEIARNLINIAINCFNAIVIEPAGNAGACEEERKNRKSIDLGIIVSGAIFNGKNLINDVTVNFFSKRTTCFAISNNIKTTTKENKYYNYGQSSGAAAIVAGLVACVQGYYYRETGQFLTHNQMKELIIESENRNKSIEELKCEGRSNQNRKLLSGLELLKNVRELLL